MHFEANRGAFQAFLSPTGALIHQGPPLSERSWSVEGEAAGGKSEGEASR